MAAAAVNELNHDHYFLSHCPSELEPAPGFLQTIPVSVRIREDGVKVGKNEL